MINLINANLQELNIAEVKLIEGGNEFTDSIWRGLGWLARKYVDGTVAYQEGVKGEY